MCLRENIPTLAEGRIRWPHRVPPSYLCFESIPTTATGNLSLGNYKGCLIEKYQHPQQGSAKSSCWFLGPWLGGGRHSSWFQSHPWKKPSHKLFFMGCRSYFNFWVQFRKWVTSYRAFLQNQSQKWSHSNYCNSGWLHSDAGYVGSQVSSIWQSPIKLCWAGRGNTHCLFPSKMFSTVLIYHSSIACLKLPWLWYKKQN